MFESPNMHMTKGDGKWRVCVEARLDNPTRPQEPRHLKIGRSYPAMYVRRRCRNALIALPTWVLRSLV